MPVVLAINTPSGIYYFEDEWLQIFNNRLIEKMSSFGTKLVRDCITINLIQIKSVKGLKSDTIYS